MQPPCRHVKMSSILRPFLDIDHPSWCRNHLKHWGDLRIHFLQYVCSIFPLKSMRIVFNHIQKRMTKDLQDLNKTLTRPEQENQPLVFCLVSHRFFPTGFLVFFGHQKNSSRTRSQQTEMENLLNVGQVQSNAPNAPRWRWRTGRNSSKVGEMEKKNQKCPSVQHIAYGLLGIGKHGKDTAEIFCCRGLDIARCFASQW